ncbi:hypothetical protein [Sphingobacterium hungaricum]|nr:hypothetical protein [Sphingobacterium hungaricum]
MRICKLIVFLSALLSYSCTSYDYVAKGFMIEGDEFYHNVDDKISFELYGDFSPYDSKSKKGVRMDKLYASDRKVLKEIGIEPKTVDFYFSGMPSMDPDYHVVLFKPKDSLLNRKRLIPQLKYNTNYFYRNFETKKYAIQYVVFPTKKGDIGFVYYDSKKSPTKDFNELIDKNIAIGKKFFPDRTDDGCEEEKGSIMVEIPEDLVSSVDYTLIKIYRKLSNGQKQLAVFNLRSPNERPYVAYRICAGDYEVQYTNIKEDILWKEDVAVTLDL